MEDTQQESTINPNNFLMTTLSIPATQLDVLCESIMDFDNLKLNGFDLFEDITKQN